MNLLLRDAAIAPHLFQWNGPIDTSTVQQIMLTHNWRIPPDLLEFWQKTGGGEIFETERVLPPVFPREPQHEVAQVTQWYRQRGLGSDLIVIHQGLGLTAVSGACGRYLYFDTDVASFRVVGEYVTMNQWYVATLRSEYAERYGLPALD